MCCRFLGSAQPLTLSVSASLPCQSGTHSLLAFTLVRPQTHSVVFLKATVLTRPSVPQRLTQLTHIRPLADTAHYKGFYLFTYLLTKL